MSFKAPVTVQGTKANAVVETGAKVTVISEQFYYQIPERIRPDLNKTKRGLVVADAYRGMKTNGITEVDFVVGKTRFKWPVYVAPIN